METEAPTSWSQVSAAGPYIEPVESSLHIYILKLSSHLLLYILSLITSFPSNIFYYFLISLMPHPSHPLWCLVK
jgi:hypothetical protein